MLESVHDRLEKTRFAWSKPGEEMMRRTEEGAENPRHLRAYKAEDQHPNFEEVLDFASQTLLRFKRAGANALINADLR